MTAVQPAAAPPQRRGLAVGSSLLRARELGIGLAIDLGIPADSAMPIAAVLM